MNIYLAIVTTCTLLLSACSNDKPNPSKQDTTSQPSQHKTGAQLAAEAKEKLAEAKGKLAEEGNYGCCIKEPCTMCLLDHDECSCYHDLKKGDDVCTECYTGWQQGKGADERIKPEDVKTKLLDHKH